MEDIIHMRLINRAYITTGSKDPLSNLYGLINTSKLSGLEVRVGTNGFYEEGPFIDGIYSTMGSVDIMHFLDYLRDIAQYLDMYNGYRSYTFLEVSVKYRISDDSDTLEATTQIIVSFKGGKVTIESVSAKTDPIPTFRSPIVQKRITQKLFKDINRNNSIFREDNDDEG